MAWAMDWEPGGKPTNLKERLYNPADEITISIILKHPRPGGASFHDYAFSRKNVPGSGLKHLCATVKTTNGVRTAGLGDQPYTKMAGRVTSPHSLSPAPSKASL